MNKWFFFQLFYHSNVIHEINSFFELTWIESYLKMIYLIYNQCILYRCSQNNSKADLKFNNFLYTI